MEVSKYPSIIKVELRLKDGHVVYFACDSQAYRRQPAAYGIMEFTESDPFLLGDEGELRRTLFASGADTVDLTVKETMDNAEGGKVEVNGGLTYNKYVGRAEFRGKPEKPRLGLIRELGYRLEKE